MSDELGIREGTIGDGVLHWSIHQPRRKHAIRPSALRWIARRCAQLDGEVVILSGSGEEAFCAGFDLTALEPGEDAEPPDAVLIRATRAMSSANATFVAALNGYAIGAGVELACSCDLRLARPGAWLKVPAGRLGVVYHAEGLTRLAHVLGPGITRRLLLAGERVEVEEVHRRGGVDAIAEDVMAAATDMARHIATQAPLSVAGNRDLLRALQAGEVGPERLAAHEEARRRAYASEDHAEARAAVAERRPPVFKGR